MGRHDTARMLVTLFAASNLLGILAALELRSVAVIQATAAANQSPLTGLWFFGLVGVATILLLLLYRYNARLLVKLWFGSALFLTTLILFAAFLPLIPAAAVTVALAVIRFRTTDAMLRNLFDMLAFAGAGALFGSILGVRAAFVLLILLAGYDYVSVFFTKHMIALAEAGTDTDTFMGFTYPRVDPDAEPEDETTDADTAVPREGEPVQVGMLGGGDIIIPMMVAITLLEYSLFASLAAMGGAAAALYLLLVKGSKKTFYPAIPVLAVGLLTGSLAWYLTTTLLTLL